MKRVVIFFIAVMLICGFAVPSLAQTSITLDYYHNDLEASDFLAYPEVDQHGMGISFEQTVGRVLLGADYLKLSNNDGNGSVHLYAAHQEIWDLKLGYRLVDGDSIKLDASLVYNRFNYDVDQNTYERDMKSTVAELKVIFLFSDKLTADLFYQRSLSSSGSDNYGDFDDEKYYSYGGRLYYNFTDNISAYLGEQRVKYVFVEDLKEVTMSGPQLGIKYNF